MPTAFHKPRADSVTRGWAIFGTQVGALLLTLSPVIRRSRSKNWTGERFPSMAPFGLDRIDMTREEGSRK